MHTGPALVAHGQPTEPMEPGQRALDDPPGAPEPATVVGAPLGELRPDATTVEHVTVGLGVVGAVPLDQRRLPHRPARPAPQRRHGVDQGEQFRDVIPIGGGQRRDERNPVRVGENMMLRPGLAAIGRVRSSFVPPRNARREALSITARARSRSPRWRNSANNTACNRFHTPARCQRTSRRQHVVPEPQPISRGNMFQGIPLRSTKRIPVSAARAGMGLRPAYCRLRGRRFGRSGSIRIHKASSINGLVMHDHLLSVTRKYQARDQSTRGCLRALRCSRVLTAQPAASGWHRVGPPRPPRRRLTRDHVFGAEDGWGNPATGPAALCQHA